MGYYNVELVRVINVESNGEVFIYVTTMKLPFIPFIGLDIGSDADHFDSFRVREIRWDVDFDCFECKDAVSIPVLTVDLAETLLKQGTINERSTVGSLRRDYPELFSTTPERTVVP